MRHLLVVANKTLHGEALAEALKGKLASEPCDLWLLVPATPVRDRPWSPAASASVLDGSAADQAGRQAYEAAEQRLAHGIELLRPLGAPVDGEVGDGDPVRAVADVVARRPVDEVVISTLPAQVSHWLHIDLAGQVHRKHHLPVTTITRDPEPARA